VGGGVTGGAIGSATAATALYRYYDTSPLTPAGRPNIRVTLKP